MKEIVYKANRIPVKVGDKVPGKRLEKYYAHIVRIGQNTVDLCYNGDVKDITVPLDVIDAEITR